MDLHPVASANLRDLDLDLFSRTYLPASVASVLDQNQRSLEEQLTSLRLAATNGLATPTVAGILVAGIRLQFLPSAYVQFLRVDGTDLADPVKAVPSCPAHCRRCSEQLRRSLIAPYI